MNNLNPDWKLLYVSLSELCDNDFNMMLKVMLLIKLFIISNYKLDRIGGFELNLFQIDVWDEDKSSRNDLIGSVQVTMSFVLQQSVELGDSPLTIINHLNTNNSQ